MGNIERWSIEVEFDPTLWKPERAREAMEEAIRKIVREEIADLPIPFDVPDELPEGA